MSNIASAFVIAASTCVIATSAVLLITLRKMKDVVTSEIEAVKKKAQEKQDDLIAVADAIGVLVKK